MSIKINNREYTKEELYSYFGDFSAIAGIRRYTLSEGKSKDCDIIEVTTGTGLILR